MTDSVADMKVSLVPELETALLKRQLKELPNMFQTFVSLESGRARDVKGKFVSKTLLSSVTERSKEFGGLLSNLTKSEKERAYNLLIGQVQSKNPRLSSPEAARYIQETLSLGGNLYNQEDKEETKKDEDKKKEKKEKKKEQDAMKNFSKSLNTFSNKLGFRGLGSFVTNPYILAGVVTGYGLKELNEKLNDIYTKRSVYGGQYSYSMRESVENVLASGDKADKFMNSFYSRFANFKSDMELGFVDTATIGAVARVTQGDPAAMNALMEGDMPGLFNALLDKASSYGDVNKARSLASRLGLPEEEFMKLLKDKNLFQKGFEEISKTGLENKGEGFANFWQNLKQFGYWTATTAKLMLDSKAQGNLAESVGKAYVKQSGDTINIFNGNIITDGKNMSEIAKDAEKKQGNSSPEITKTTTMQHKN